MESLLVEQSLSPRKQIKTPKRKPYHHINHPQSHQMQQILARNLSNITRQSSLNHNYAPPLPPPPPPFLRDFDSMTTMHGGFFLNNHPSNIHTTTPYYHPLSSYTSLPPMFLHQKTANHQHHHHQPPLLPLPAVARPSFSSLPPLSRGKSVPKKSSNKTKTPLKSKKVDKNVAKHDNNNTNNNNIDDQVDKDKRAKDGHSDEVVNGPTEETEPGPTKAQQQKIAKVLLADLDAVVAMEMEKFSGSVFGLAPPPSSLPLPKFSLRQLRHRHHQQPPKLSCNAEAGAAVAEVIVDDGATDNLCKLLRLR